MLGHRDICRVTADFTLPSPTQHPPGASTGGGGQQRLLSRVGDLGASGSSREPTFTVLTSLT